MQQASPPSLAPAAAAQPVSSPQRAPDPPRHLQRSIPVSLNIPAINLHTNQLVRLGLTSDGRMQSPQAWQFVGWYRRGPVPGQKGPAVLAGHVDSDAGPAVFYRLGVLRPGDEVRVTRADEKTAVFRVYAVQSYPKNDFPTGKVYGDTGHPELRLITCGGSFNKTTQHYVSNIVAYARMVAVR